MAPLPPGGDIENRRSHLNAMLAWANDTAQPIADEVETTNDELTVADGTTMLALLTHCPRTTPL